MALRCDLEQPAGFFVAGGAAAVLVFAVVAIRTGRDAGEANQLPPAEGGTRGAIFLLHGVEVLFAVQTSVFADRVLEHPVIDGSGRRILLAVEGNRRGGAAL